MDRRLGGSRFAVVLVALGALLPALAQPLPVAASTSGTLFGLGPTTIVKVDPASGASTLFADLPIRPDVSPFQSFNALVSDPARHRLFTLRTAFSSDFSTAYYNLITVDSQSAALTVGPDMESGITDMVYDPSSGALFGQTNMCCPFEFVRIDPVTGAQTTVGDIPGVQPLRMAIAPAKRAVYFATESFVAGQFQPVITMVTVDLSTGTISQSPPMTTGVFAVVYDTTSGNLFGKTFCCSAALVRINPATGAQAVVASGLNFGSGIAMDSSTHSVFMTDDDFSGFSFRQFIQTVNDQSGASTLSSGALPTDAYIGALAFEGVAITPDSIEADVRSALASGAITNAGVESSLLSELDAAAAARQRGDCTSAGRIYRAFVAEVQAQSGRALGAATASQLIGEAQFLIANCP